MYQTRNTGWSCYYMYYVEWTESRAIRVSPYLLGLDLNTQSQGPRKSKRERERRRKEWTLDHPTRREGTYVHMRVQRNTVERGSRTRR